MSQSAGADGRILWQHALPAGARTPWTYLSTVARRARMPHVQYWARVRDGPARAKGGPRCGALAAVGWSDADWRAFEVRTGRPASGTLARARARALKALATAFGLRA